MLFCMVVIKNLNYNIKLNTYLKMEEIDLSKELQEFYEKNKDNKLIRNYEETLDQVKGGFLRRNLLKIKVIGDGIKSDEVIFNSVFNNKDFVFSFKQSVYYFKTFLMVEGNNGSIRQTFLKVDYSNFGSIERKLFKVVGQKLFDYDKDTWTKNKKLLPCYYSKDLKHTSTFLYLNDDIHDLINKKYKIEYIKFQRGKNEHDKDTWTKNIKRLKLELTKKYDDCKTLINDIKNTQGKKLDLNKIEIKLNEQKRMIEVNSRFLNNEPVISDLDLLKDLNTKFQKHQKIITNLLIELNQLNNLKQSQTNVLSELDKDGNGEVDVIEGNDFNLLLKKHQKSIVEIDRTYVQQFVKISGYLKTKEKNIQSIFNLIKDTPNQEVLKEYVEVLKDDIHSYNLILFNSLNMIVSLVEDDMITFYEIL